MIDLAKNLSIICRRTKSSVIRELLSQSVNKNVISLAGGLPAPETFPQKAVADIIKSVVDKNADAAFQYGPTEGMPELRQALCGYLRETEGITARPENILVTSASQQALDLVGRTFIDAGDQVLMELPSYIGALQAFGACGADMRGVHSDNNGIEPQDLEEKLAALRRSEDHYKFLYIVPDFQNPTGVTLSAERRLKISELASRYNCLVVEDTPYRQVRFEGAPSPMIYKTHADGNVLSLFTFSKTLFPGFRLGFILGDEAIIAKMTKVKQPLDLCSSSFTQLVVAEYINSGEYQRHLPEITGVYRRKKTAMVQALEKYMPADAGISWTNPQGGLFLWLTLPPRIDTAELFPEAAANGVVYVVGSPFHCDGSGQNTMRLNFSYPTETQIDDGIKRLAEVIKNRLAQKPH